MKQILAISFITGLLFFSGPGPAYSREDYFIEDEWVLLYKVVNWWYTCLEPDSQWLCGQSIRFESHGEIQVSGNCQDSKMDLILPKDCADQLSIFTNPMGKTYFKLTWQHPDYFPVIKGVTLSPKLSSLDQLSVTGISKEDRPQIRSLIPLLGIQIQGKIRGLVNNRIALHPVDSTAKNQIRSCPKPEDSTPFPVSLFIVHTPSGETLARYEMAWE